MKSPNIYHVLFILLFLFGISLPAYTQVSYYPISYDTLIAGDTMIIRDTCSLSGQDKLYMVLIPYGLYYQDCPVCKDDTIKSFKTELYSGSTYDFYFAVPLGTIPGMYQIAVYFEDNLYYVGGLINVYTPPYIFKQPKSNIVCAGYPADFSIRVMGNVDEPLWYQWFQNKVKYAELSDSTWMIESVQLQDTGIFYCVVSNYFGTDTSDAVRLDLYPGPANPGPPEGPDRFCPGIDTSKYIIHSDPLATAYDWHLLPETAGDIQQNDTSVLIIWDKEFSGMAQLYVNLVSGECGFSGSDILEITVPGLSPSPEICIVGFDEEIDKYRIVWEKSGNVGAQLYTIYRESNQADVYLEIGSVNPGELSLFIDSTSTPNLLSHRYKISYTDSCGFESELSTYHQTIHLTANLGLTNEVNLNWSEYMGIPFPTYDIYRGNHPDSMSVLIQVPSTVTSFTDDNPPTGMIYYQIGMSNPSGCNPSIKADPDYSSSLSNIDQVNVSGIEEVNENNGFKLYPNPAKNELQVTLKGTFTDHIQYAVYNSIGITVLKGLIKERSISLDVSSLTSGPYIIQVLNNSEVYSMRLMIINERD